MNESESDCVEEPQTEQKERRNERKSRRSEIKGKLKPRQR